VLDAFGLGSGRDGLALGDLVVIGRLDAVDAIRTAGRRLDGGTIVQVAADEFGASGDERGGRWRRVVSYEGADSPAAASRWRAVAPPWFPVAPVTKTTLSRWSSTLFSFCARWPCFNANFSNGSCWGRGDGATFRPPPNRCQQSAARP
jgi:hypothetical protein